MNKKVKISGTILFIFATFFLFLPMVSAFDWSNDTIVDYFSLDEGTASTYNSQTSARTFTTDLDGEWEVPGFIGNNTILNNTGADGYASPTTQESYTWSFWINTTGFSGAASAFIISQDGTGDRLVDTFNSGSANGGAIAYDHNNAEVLSADNIVNDSEWHHIVALYNGDNRFMRLFIDGDFIGEQSNVDLGTTTADLDIGKEATAHNQLYNGSLDEFGFWNRSFTYQEVKDLYNNGFGVAYQVQPPINISHAVESMETETLNLGDLINVSGSSVSSARLFYNGTFLSNTVTITNVGGGLFSMNASSFDTPILPVLINNVSDREWLFEATLANGTVQNGTTNNNLVRALFFEQCSARFPNVFVNFTFANETTAQEPVTASFLSTWNFYSGSGSVTKSLTFNDASENPSYGFCSDVSDETIFAVPTVTYDNDESQPRGYAPGILTLSSSTTDITLFLLPTSLGIFATIQVIDLAGTPIQNARITLSDTEFGTIESRVTGTAGTATFFVDPLNVYTIDASASGFSSFTGTNMFATTEFTIVLAGAGSNVTDPTAGITFTIAPTQTFLANNTNFTFEFDIDATKDNLVSYGFFLENGTTILFNAPSASASRGSTVSLNINTGNQSNIIMNAFYIVGGETQNVTRIWVVRDEDFLTQWSIRNFSDRLSTYLQSGIFGLTPFGLGLIVFLLIFLITGVLSFRFGLNTPIAISSIVLTLTAFFDVALGLFPNPIGAVPNFPTILVAFITIAIVFREVFK